MQLVEPADGCKGLILLYQYLQAAGSHTQQCAHRDGNPSQKCTQEVKAASRTASESLKQKGLPHVYVGLLYAQAWGSQVAMGAKNTPCNLSAFSSNLEENGRRIKAKKTDARKWAYFPSGFVVTVGNKIYAKIITRVLKWREQCNHLTLSSPHGLIFIYSESHGLSAGVLLSDINPSVLLKIKSKWEMLIPKTELSFLSHIWKNIISKALSGSKEDSLFKTMNQREYLLRKQRHAGTSRSSWKTLAQFHPTKPQQDSTTKVCLAKPEWRQRKAPCQPQQQRWLYGSVNISAYDHYLNK